MERNSRKERVGIVVSNKMDKTIVVAVVNKYKHPLYKKTVSDKGIGGGSDSHYNIIGIDNKFGILSNHLNRASASAGIGLSKYHSLKADSLDASVFVGNDLHGIYKKIII